MEQELIELICQRLTTDLHSLQHSFQQKNTPIRMHCVVIDNLLPESITNDIYQCFPPISQMRLLTSFRERKYTFKQLNQLPALLKDITFALQDKKVVKLVEQITGIRHQVPDPSLYAGGLSTMTIGNFLNPHIDNSHNNTRELYRTLNLLFYVTPNWQAEYGGNLELWDAKVKHAITIPSLFNRLVLMETNRYSWHAVSPIVTNKANRCCVSNYYFSPYSPEKFDYFNVTSFSARPEQVFRRIVAQCDNQLRNGMRKIRKLGFGKKDLFQPQ